MNRAQSESATGWITVLDEEVSFDLLQVAGVEGILGTAELEPGKYVQTRMHVSSVVVTLDGEETEARVPSEIIRIVRPITIVAGETTIATFDFDAQKSVVITGRGQALFKPVIKLLVRKGTEPFQPSVPASVEEATPVRDPDT